jgi:hypothetical protein
MHRYHPGIDRYIVTPRGADNPRFLIPDVFRVEWPNVTTKFHK